MIVPVTEENLTTAAIVHAEAWRASHASFCSPDFVAAHTVQRQEAYLRDQLAVGKSLWMLKDPEPVGIVSVFDNTIENLYVLPSRQRQGYGFRLLSFAIAHCSAPRLWVLSNNTAIDFYRKAGFVLSGIKKPLSPSLSELEMVYHP